MTDLTNKLVSNTYKQLILVSSAVSNTGVDTSLKPVQTGDGTNTALQVAVSAIKVTGDAAVSGNVSVRGNIHADDRVVYGSLDDFSKNEIVVSDRAFSVSKLVSCSDLQGRSVVGCGGIERMKWVELTIQRDGKVKKIKQISQAQYEKEVNSLD